MEFFKDTWYVLDEYFKSKYFLTKHHLDSYNDFVLNKLPNTIKVLNPFVILKNQDNGALTHEINVYVGGIDGKEIFINKPTIVDSTEGAEQRVMYPNEARLKDMTYKSEIFANILVRYVTTENGKETVEQQVFQNVKIGSLPIMLHSCLCVLNNQPSKILHEMGECVYDQGGYFVMDGKEKVIVAQERIATNRIFINKSKDPKYSYEGLIRCTSEENPLFPKTIHLYVHQDRLTKKKINSVDDGDDADDSDDDVEGEDGGEDEEEGGDTKSKKAIQDSNAIVIESPNIGVKIPLFVLFRALGVESDKSIIEHIVLDIEEPSNKGVIDMLRHSLLHGAHIRTQEQAMEYLANFVEYKSVDKVRHILINDIFPNVGNEFKNKALFLGHIINKLVKVVLGVTKESDRDSYMFKRVDISGFLVANLFRDYYNQFRQTVRDNIDRQYLYGPWRTLKDIKNLVNKGNLNYIFQYAIIEDGMRKSLKGSWGVNMVEEQQDADDIKQGIVQDVSRISYMGFMSHLRRVNTPMDPTSKIVAPHRLHPSQWGIMCPCESPDGASIGLLKNFAIMCNVTFDCGTQNIMKCLLENDLLLLADMNPHEIPQTCKVLINSNWVGVHKDPVSLVKKLKLLKRNALINIFTSISWNIISNEISILTEAGRCCRPLYVIKDGKLLIEKYIEDVKRGKLTWNDLVRGFSVESFDPFADVYIQPSSILKGEGKDNVNDVLEKNQCPIEYVDVEETNNAMIAMDPSHIGPQHMYCEIHPATILSIVTHNICLAHHNQAPRNIFSGAQGKQAIGCYATNFNNRIDTMSYVLHYPQKPLIGTRFAEYCNLNRVPNGENTIVAIATYTGYNMEDSIIMNKDSVMRGMFNLTYYKNIIAKEEENPKDNEIITFNNPNELIQQNKALQELKWANYSKLDENGFPKLNCYVSEGDAILGKTKIKTELVEDDTVENNIFGSKVKKEMFYDRSMIADKTISGLIDKVYLYFDEEGKKTCKVRFRKVRTPELGDKCCSRAAQKGVVGMLVPAENMPFTKDGIVPDLIINPHAIPSRMTLGHLLECLLGKAACQIGSTIDGTPFNPNDYEHFYDILEKDYKMERHGNEIMYNGFTGEQMATEIFIGPTYYERLKHMVSDKINYRQINLRTIYNGSKQHILKDAPVNATTRQPTKGRGNNGGLRIGEMEKDTILSHGMAGFLKESLMERSDKFDMQVDKTIGHILKDPYVDGRDVAETHVPFAFKQLMQEVTALSIKPYLDFEPIDEVEESWEDAYVDNMVEGKKSDDGNIE